MYLTNTARHEM